MINLFANTLVITGALILMGAMLPIRRLITQLPAGHVRLNWYTLTALIIFFIVGYSSYALAFWKHHTYWADLIVPCVFFFGAIFVWLAAALSLQTAVDIRRMTILEHENITDPLVGIYNRRYLDRRLEEEFARAKRYDSPLSVLLIDVDHFKRINDVHGHHIGDLALYELGKLILQSIRETDIVARYGGDEIVIIAPNTTTHLAEVLAERLRQNVENQNLALKGESDKSKDVHLTVSIGIADLTQEAKDSRALMLNADQMLYHAKKEGRNRVVIYGVIPSRPGFPLDE